MPKDQSDSVTKARPALDGVPKDVALIIAELVRTFATVKKQNEEERKRIRM